MPKKEIDKVIKETEFTLKQFDKLPASKRKEGNPLYQNILDSMKDKPKGFYQVNVSTDLKLKTLYYGLKAKIREENSDMKLAIREDRLFIVKN